MINFEAGELRARIEEGLKRDDTPYIQDIGRILDLEGIETGASIDLGKDPEVAQRISDLLGVDESIQEGETSVSSVIIADRISQSVKGSLVPFVEETGVVRSLPLLQANKWDQTKFGAIESLVTVASLGSNEKGESIFDTTRPLIRFTAVGIYKAAMQKRFAQVYSDVLSNYDLDKPNPNVRQGEVRYPSVALNRYLAETGEDLGVPMRYGIDVGTLGKSYAWTPGFSIQTRRAYVRNNSRIVRKKEID